MQVWPRVELIHAVARPAVNAQFRNTLAKRLAITKVANCEPVEANKDASAGSIVPQSREPLPDHILASRCQIPADLDHRRSVAYKLQSTRAAIPRISPLV